ncbi:POK11 protein, partial [Trogon melanurus]|nr:POK11 protein [Trogon melanurus]
FIKLQKLHLENNISTLNDLQKLLGTINWIHPMLGISTAESSHLSDALKGGPESTSP